MDTENKSLALLFEQLGMDGDQASIDAFIEKHYPLPDDMKLTEAPFWSEGQRAMLAEHWVADDDWEPFIDELNVRLHENKDGAGAV